MDVKKTGKFICALRKEKALTQAALAEMLGISNRTVSKWENGDGMPDIALLPGVANVFDVTVDELLKGERNPAPVADIKVTEIESRDNLDNIFLISYVISLFVGIFGAVLGGINELYCIWAFRILFYTHWEIIFAAMSFFSVVLSGLIYSVGVTRLGVSYSRAEIMRKVGRRTWTLSLILAVFPSTFLLRLADCFAPRGTFWCFAAAIILALAVLFIYLYKKLCHSKI